MNGDGPERASQPKSAVPPPQLSEQQRAEKEAENGLRQFDRMVELIEAALAAPGSFRLRVSTLTELNRLAVDGLIKAPGSLRSGSIDISNSVHAPPPPEQVMGFLDEMCEYVQDHWASTPVHLSAYLLWRLNWIHPFEDGNGRTSRAVSYLVLGARLGHQLPGTKTIPERIAENKTPYYAALDQADASWKAGSVDVHLMEELLEQHLRDQLVETFKAATGH